MLFVLLYNCDLHYCNIKKKLLMKKECMFLLAYMAFMQEKLV